MPASGMVRGWAAVAAAVGALAGATLIALPQQAPPREAPPQRTLEPRGPTPHSTEPATLAGSGEARQQAVDGLLRRRADALRARDEAGFMASVDPKAPAEFQRSQRAMFHNLAEVPLASWSYEVDGASADSTRSASAEEVWSPRVNLTYALDGVDTVPTTRPVHHRFARHGGSWYVTGPSGAEAWRGPWDFGACRVVHTGSGLVLGHDSNQALAHRVAPMVDAARSVVTEVWGTDWSQRVGVLIPESRAELQAMVGPRFAVDGIAAVAVADRVDSGRRRVEGPRVVLNPEMAEKLSDGALRVVIQHEITHIAARADTAEGASMWLLEGFADYVGYRGSGYSPGQIAPDLVRQVYAVGPPADFPADADFQGSGRALDLAYQQSWSIVDFLSRRFGEQRVVELYRRIAGTGSEQEVEPALREITGLSKQDLLAQWGAHLRHGLN